ncbi:MAG: methionine adenosyltransferase [Candidatus Kapabacteria bacterium]|nr:methionine adenosyltransferase [Candidatus Kapabacteria bacterium]
MLDNKNYLFTSESVSEGHPDKLCDQVSDAVLDAMLTEDPMSRVACECFATTGMLLIGGEITTQTYVDIPKLAREVIADIGYTKGEYRFSSDSCAILNVINQQSPDIAMGVDTGGAGDQGMMFGYAVDETPELMPATLVNMPYLRPDSKSQVTIEYNDKNEIVRVNTVVVSTQHDPDVAQTTIKNDMIEKLIKNVIPAQYLDENTIYHVNPTGNFVIGGPHGDSGLTGRKIIVDTYGGRAPHGGGAFSGKDATKVDRSAAYAARHLAKNIVAAGIAKECTIQLSYAIGVEQPISINVNTHGTSTLTNADIANFISKNIDLTPKGIITRLDLRKPIFRASASYGHFGRDIFPWEKLDLVESFKKNLA